MNTTTLTAGDATGVSTPDASATTGLLGRTLTLAYGTVSYAIFFATFLYAVGFVMTVGVPTGLDSAPRIGFGAALATNIVLLTIFALQHSVMARPTFKRWWTQFVPVAAERSTYTLFSSLALIALFVFWEPMGGVIWNVTWQPGRIALITIGASGWFIVLASTFMINHFDLFGLRQVWLHFRGKPYTPLQFKTPFFYKYVRHPLYVGWFLAFWGAPVMTGAHLLFALMTSAYILVAIQLEERNLIEDLGDDYAAYRRRVPMLIPGTKRRRTA